MSDPQEIGPFRIVRRLGVGGMGLVFEAIYKKNNRHVALKLLSPDLAADAHLIARFDREMEILKKLKHPNIIRYFGGGSVDKRRFYAMELLGGGSLDDKLKERGRLSWEQTIDYAKQIAKALEHAHNAGVIHRDLKPANLLITDGGSLKLSDFGIARDTQRTALTAAGKTVGTMAYMAPEQIHGRDPIGRRTDLYALGCVMFQMLTGKTPFESETQPEMLFKHVEEVPQSVRELAPDCPIYLENLVAELLEKEPQDRPFDALAVQVKLDEIRHAASGPTVAGATRKDVTLATGGATMKRDLEKLAIKKKKKRKKKKEESSFFESLAFLIPLLLGVIGLIAWAVWPASEADLYREAAALMASDKASDWKDARDRYIRPLLDRFPETEYKAETEIWLDQIAMHDAEKQAELRMRLGKDPLSEAERLFVAAKRLELTDRISALDRYRSIESAFASNPEERPFVNLARKAADRLASQVGQEGDALQVIEEKIENADRLWVAGKKVEARDSWIAIERLYKGNPEFDVQVARVRERLVPNQTDRVIREELLAKEKAAAEKTSGENRDTAEASDEFEQEDANGSSE